MLEQTFAYGEHRPAPHQEKDQPDIKERPSQGSVPGKTFAPPARGGLASRGGIALDYSDFAGEDNQDFEDEDLEEHSGLTEVQRVEAALDPFLSALREVEELRETRILIKSSELAEMRVEALRELSEVGSMAGLLNMYPSTRNSLEIDPLDVVGRGIHLLLGFVELFQLSLRNATGDEVFDLPAITQLLTESMTALAKCQGDIIRVGKTLQSQGHSSLSGEEFYAANEERLDVLLGTLTKRYTKVSLAKVFPEESAQSIVDWYLRLNVLLIETSRTREAYRHSVREVAKHWLADPGPPLSAHARAPLSSSTKKTTSRVSSLKTVPSAVGKDTPSFLGFGYRPGGGNMAHMIHQEAEKAIQDGRDPGLAYAFATRAKDSGEKVPTILIPRKKTPLSAHDEVDDDVSVLTVKSGGLRRSTASSSGDTEWDAFIAEMDRKVTRELSKHGRLTTISKKIIMDNIHSNPLFTMGKGNELKFMSSFPTMLEKISPEILGDYVNVSHWLTMLKEQSASFGLPIKYLFTFMKDHGGLKKGLHPDMVAKVKTLFSIVKMKKWLPDYDPGHPADDDHYWIPSWVSAQLQLVIHFWRPTNDAVNTTQVRTVLKKLKLTQGEDDPLNNEMYKVADTFDGMIAVLEERDGLRDASYARLLAMLRDHLKTLSPAGPFFDQLLGEGLRLLTTAPTQFLLPGHGRTQEDLDELCLNGEHGLQPGDFELLFSTLRDKATAGSLHYKAESLSALRNLVASEATTSAPSKKAEKKAAVLSVTMDTTGMKSLNVNSGGGGGAGRGGGGGGALKNSDYCTTCSLFHKVKGGPCPYYDKVKKVVKITAMLATPGVLFQNRTDKSWFVGTWFKDKLKNFAFRAMSITGEAEQKKILDEMDRVATSLGKCEVLPAHLGGHSGKASSGSDKKAGGSNSTSKGGGEKKALSVLEQKLAGAVKELEIYRKAAEEGTRVTVGLAGVAEGEDQDAEEDHYWDPDAGQWITPGGDQDCD